jgi:hypothetical protein
MALGVTPLPPKHIPGAGHHRRAVLTQQFLVQQIQPTHWWLLMLGSI